MSERLSGPQTAVPCCPAHDTDAVLDGLPAPLRLWARPIRDQLAMASATAGKPVGQLTMPELAAWGIIGFYCVGTGLILGRLAGNLTAAAIRGPGRR